MRIYARKNKRAKLHPPDSKNTSLMLIKYG